jgi:hypothetical protein
MDVQHGSMHSGNERRGGNGNDDIRRPCKSGRRVGAACVRSRVALVIIVIRACLFLSGPIGGVEWLVVGGVAASAFASASASTLHLLCICMAASFLDVSASGSGLGIAIRITIGYQTWSLAGLMARSPSREGRRERNGNEIRKC